MADQSATFRVTLDTTEAKARLRELELEGEAAAGRIGDGLRGRMRSGLEALGLGAAAGFGFGMAKRFASNITAGPIGDVWSEATAGVRADVDLLIGGPEARGSRQAREETKDAYAEIASRIGGVTPDVVGYYKQIRVLRENTEKGRALIDQALGGGRADEKSIIEQIVEPIVGAIAAGFDMLSGVIRMLGGGGRG